MLYCYLLLINVFKCNLKELTTKSANSARGQRSVFKHMRNCAVFHLCGIGQAMRGVSFSQRGRKQSSSSSPPPPFFFALFFQCDGCLFFVSCAWGLMAGLQRCASHGGVFQSWGWLPKVKALGRSRHPTSTKR